jgi:hypothetical protein
VPLAAAFLLSASDPGVAAGGALQLLPLHPQLPVEEQLAQQEALKQKRPRGAVQ